ncbi:MAG: response regulator [Kofleriaceae bacterium]|nr:response regulator [Myxococcales bacterium]MCB9560038.1 response regulator [Kofleriaceae bacterium]MCB9571911.1 response regulator [Kofleriaceae bacterium]
MRRDGALLGKLLLEREILPDARALDDVLARQSLRLPVASLCYILGYSPERPLIATLSTVRGRPGVVLDESVVHLEVLGALPRETAMRARVLPLFEDARRVVVAAVDPSEAAAAIAAAEVERVRGKRVELYIALEITLARTIRAAYLGRARGDSYWVGIEAMVDPQARGGKLALVAPDDPEGGRVDDAARAHRALVDDVTKEIAMVDLMLDEEDAISSSSISSIELATPRRDAGPPTEENAASTGWSSSGSNASTGADSTSGLETPWPEAGDDEDPELVELIAELDAVPAPTADGQPRVLIVDDDFATRHLLVKELQPLGYVTATAASAGEAVRAVRQGAPDLVVCDILLPEVDGFRLCRAIKRSVALGHVPVVLMSAVIDSGRVTDDVLARYGADAYVEKPLDSRRLHKVVRELLGRRRSRSSAGEQGFQRAIELYQRGDVDGAIGLLRGAVTADPSSAKYRFVLANLLQRKSQHVEAIDEYEGVVELEPEYFPALTRLAYLYYKQGMVARAVDTWRRSLPLCPDPLLRRNIELFMRKLIVDMGAIG